MSVHCQIGVEDYVDNLLAENSALRRKLQSKAEALLILSKDLEQCRNERDQFKLMAEQLQDRYSTLKKKTHEMGFCKSVNSDDSLTSGNSLLEVLGETREQNKSLKLEVDDLRQRLRDAHGDIKVLRSSLNHQKLEPVIEDSYVVPTYQKEQLVEQLEKLNEKCAQLQTDFQSVLDEKEELVTERDAYKCKVHRLNHELNNVLKADGKKLIDIDALIMENRYFQERLQQMEEEHDMAKQALLKYKGMLDVKRNKGVIKLGTNSGKGMVMTHKQVQQLLEQGTTAQLPNTAATLADMRSLCLALLEALGDKSLALAHQKKANKILASRVSEVEQRLATVQGEEVTSFPSQLLLDGYSSSDVDKDVAKMVQISDFQENILRKEMNEAQKRSTNWDVKASIDRAHRIEKQSDDALDALPPKLEQLVQRALLEMKQDAKVL